MSPCCARSKVRFSWRGALKSPVPIHEPLHRPETSVPVGGAAARDVGAAVEHATRSGIIASTSSTRIEPPLTQPAFDNCQWHVSCQSQNSFRSTIWPAGMDQIVNAATPLLPGLHVDSCHL